MKQVQVAQWAMPRQFVMRSEVPESQRRQVTEDETRLATLQSMFELSGFSALQPLSMGFQLSRFWFMHFSVSRVWGPGSLS